MNFACIYFLFMLKFDLTHNIVPCGNSLVSPFNVNFLNNYIKRSYNYVYYMCTFSLLLFQIKNYGNMFVVHTCTI